MHFNSHHRSGLAHICAVQAAGGVTSREALQKQCVFSPQTHSQQGVLPLLPAQAACGRGQHAVEACCQSMQAKQGVQNHSSSFCVSCLKTRRAASMQMYMLHYRAVMHLLHGHGLFADEWAAASASADANLNLCSESCMCCWK